VTTATDKDRDMTPTISRPLPVRTPVTAPFWEAAHKKEFHLPYCDSCNETHFPPSPRCPHCLSEDITWRPASGKATLISWIVFQRAYWDGVKEDLPYNVCIVRLDEGPRMLSNLIGEAEKKPRYGMPLKVTFSDRFPDLTLPVFDTQ
jgi:uncharacterized protein